MDVQPLGVPSPTYTLEIVIYKKAYSVGVA